MLRLLVVQSALDYPEFWGRDKITPGTKYPDIYPPYLPFVLFSGGCTGGITVSIWKKTNENLTCSPFAL